MLATGQTRCVQSFYLLNSGNFDDFSFQIATYRYQYYAYLSTAQVPAGFFFRLHDDVTGDPVMTAAAGRSIALESPKLQDASHPPENDNPVNSTNSTGHPVCSTHPCQYNLDG
jgi:hypothetical protein